MQRESLGKQVYRAKRASRVQPAFRATLVWLERLECRARQAFKAFRARLGLLARLV